MCRLLDGRAVRHKSLVFMNVGTDESDLNKTLEVNTVTRNLKSDSRHTSGVHSRTRLFISRINKEFNLRLACPPSLRSDD